MCCAVKSSICHAAVLNVKSSCPDTRNGWDSAAISGASVLDASDNLALLTDLVTDMADIDQTASLDAGVKRLPAQRITFDSESSRQRVTILALTLIPGVLLLTMAVVLLKRRRL